MGALLDGIPVRPQRQDSMVDQLQDLVRVATRLGMYDAADSINQAFELGKSLAELERRKKVKKTAREEFEHFYADLAGSDIYVERFQSGEYAEKEDIRWKFLC